ncbi:nuclear transport factor 2 family protein [Actinomadura madurae]|uniref:nuclear transport factor 2 family protein n=1 Tax=Actinomadura madurae TaxID=1993 RepID=UPI002026BCA6|nr:nuclear transport factor 2 family protein [Actinomadura madurae]URM96925.1 nuclear transport factor 2 family protein [Actinomadura madurae]URN07705.1 nuclear transport factor 2 family protein [Actinomadura madurae]
MGLQDGPGQIGQLLDKQQITELLYRYCRGIDRLDWDLVRDCYHVDAVDDHDGTFRGGTDAFIDHFRPRLERDVAASMHTIGNVLIELDGDVAGCESHIVGRLLRRGSTEPDRVFVAAARYVDRMERRGGGPWRIARRTVLWEWTSAEPLAAARPEPGAHRGRRDRSDASYEALSVTTPGQNLQVP